MSKNNLIRTISLLSSLGHVFKDERGREYKPVRVEILGGERMLLVVFPNENRIKTGYIPERDFKKHINNYHWEEKE